MKTGRLLPLVTVPLLCMTGIARGGEPGSSPTPASPQAMSVKPRSFDVRLYGAVGDGKTDDAGAIQRAIDACAQQGGAVVVLDNGVFLTGTVWNWAPVMTDIVKSVHDGTWAQHPGQDWWYGLARGGVELAPFSDLVPHDVQELVDEKEQAIIDGSFQVFPGMTDEEMREMYYFESNVVGDLP